MEQRILLTILVCGLGLTAPAYAETLVVDDMDDSIVSGTVTRVQGESIFITYAGRDFEIQLDDLDIDTQVADLFAPGMEITARGELEDDGYTPVMEAREIVRAEPGVISGTEAILLTDDD